MSQTAVFKKVVDGIKDMVAETNLDCTEEGMTLQSMDSSHVALVSLHLDARGFEHYNCSHPLSLGVNLHNMSKILKCGNNDDVFTMMHKTDKDVLTMMFEGNNSISDFDLKLMDIDSEQLGIPEVDFAAVITMASSEFQRICRDLQTIGDSMDVSVDTKGIKFAVQGATGNGTMTVLPTDGETGSRVTLECTEPVCLSFALRYLNFFTKATPLAETVTLRLSPGIPLMVTYNIQDIGALRFFLAPKVEDEMM